MAHWWNVAWAFVKNPANQEAIGWVFLKISAVAGAIWVVVKFFFKKKGRDGPTLAVRADEHSVAIGHDNYGPVSVTGGSKEYSSLREDAFKYFESMADEYETAVYVNTQKPDRDFWTNLQRVSGKLKVHFGENSGAWQAFIAFDNLIYRVKPWPTHTEFLEARDKVKTAMLSQMDIKSLRHTHKAR
jgi:hypothetical protein